MNSRGASATRPRRKKGADRPWTCRLPHRRAETTAGAHRRAIAWPAGCSEVLPRHARNLMAGQARRAVVISHRRLANRRVLPCAHCEWALDSGGFTELALHGAWRTSAAEYVEAVARYSEEIGRLQWAAPMDWMCEPSMLSSTGLTVREHQERTVANYLSCATGDRSSRCCRGGRSPTMRRAQSCTGAPTSTYAPSRLLGWALCAGGRAPLRSHRSCTYSMKPGSGHTASA